VPLSGGDASPTNTDNATWAEAYLCTKLHLDLSSHLTTIDMGLKVAGMLCPFFGRGSYGRAGSLSNTM